MNFKEYLNNGQFETFIPGIRANFELGKKSDSIDKFLAQKEASSFAFISFNDFSKFGPIDSVEAERAFLDSQEESEMSLLMKAGREGWRYYLAGFRPRNNWGSLGGILVLDGQVELLKKQIDAAGYKWLVKGSPGIPSELVAW